MTRSGVASVLILVLAAVPSGAAVVCVSPSNPACQATIQAGVNAASAGDTVNVAPGVYFENVVIPPGKDGLTLRGANRLTTILDPDVPNTGPGITIQSDSVQVSDLTIRNGQAHGVVVDPVADGAILQRLRIVAIRGGHGIGVASGTTGHQVLDNVVRAVAVAGILLEGNDNSVVKGNVVMQTLFAIFVAGQNVEVLSNRVANTFFGIVTSGNFTKVSGNVVENGAILGSQVSGANPTVRLNRLIEAGGLTIQCLGCTGGSVSHNSIVGSRFFGMSLAADGAGLVAQANRVAHSQEGAFLIKGVGIQAVRNVASDSSGGCFNVFDSTGPIGHTLIRNLAARCGPMGFYVNGDNVTLDSNISRSGDAFGFLVDGINAPNPAHFNATLTNNRALFTNGQGFGITNGAQDTTLTGNLGSKNRLDLCDQGVGTNTAGGNTFASTSATCDVQ